METKIIEVKIPEVQQLKMILGGELEKVDYATLSKFYMLFYNELKRRDMSIGQSTGNCRSGNYKGELK